ncbi:MAG: hypothetical protein JO183_04525, partial [Ktedonobacteraceae bacterium]|nr:hypothetical protein [Ktedonobacteraceae bacterium]
YNPHAYWYLDHRGLHSDHQMGVCQNCSLFRRSAFDVVDGYPHSSVNNDQVIHERLSRHPDVKQAEEASLQAHEWFYIYRWGVSPVHLSSRRSPDTWSTHIGQMPVIPGRYVLRPHWKQEYVSTTRNALGMSPYLV